MQGERKTLTQLSVPICLETLFYMLSGMVDTLMLSSVSDQAVGAVGTANTYIGVFIIMFGVISSGMVAVMSQNIGAGKPGIAYQARQLGLVFNALTGILISVVLAVFSGGILRAVSIAPALLESAETYLKIVGGASFLNALIPIFSSYLRVFGYTKHSLIINIILNSVFLFVFNWGVMGVAAATVFSKVVNLIIVAAMGAVLIKAKQSPEREQPRRILAQIVKIGFPSAFETALYNVAMTFIVRFMNQMDTDGMNVTARSYAMQIANFSYCVGAALAQANAIMTGWRIGANIKVAVRTVDGTFTIHVANTYVIADPDKAPDDFEKIDFIHGYGLKNVKDSAEACGGFCVINHENDIYSATVIIPVLNP